MKRLHAAIFLLVGLALMPSLALCASSTSHESSDFPRSLESYSDGAGESIPSILIQRVKEEPFNLVATLIFLCAIVHTFMAGRFLKIAHDYQHIHEERIKRREVRYNSLHPGAELFHFLGEVEVVFGLWAVALIGAILGFHGWHTVVDYVGHGVNFTEPVFVVVIMVLASTRPILRLSEKIVMKIAALLGGSLAAFWFAVLTLGPLLGSFVTEPAAMTISALLLAGRFYNLNPSKTFKYATIGILFVNVSVGGTMTHFAAPPVLMVSGAWDWGIQHMMVNFGWKAALGILISNGLYLAAFRREFADLQKAYAVKVMESEIETKYVTRGLIEEEFTAAAAEIDAERHLKQRMAEEVDQTHRTIRSHVEERALASFEVKDADPSLIREAFESRFQEIRLHSLRRFFPILLPEKERAEFIDPDWDRRDDPVPFHVTAVHIAFMAWTIVNAHTPPLFVLGLLFFLGFAHITANFQNRVDLKPAMLVGFFLAGLVIHGGVQGWWIAPVLGGLTEFPLMLGATILTAFNDNAAITYLSTLVPDFTDSLKYAVVAGAVTGGGLTVIANAPNPAGQSILKDHFGGAVSPIGLATAAIIPTIVQFVLMWFL